MTEEISRDRFADAKGEKFTFTDGNGKVFEFDLVEVSSLRERPAYRSFALVFVGPEDTTVEQGLYDLDHGSLGPLQIFLVPIGIENGRPRLEAVFNLLRNDK